MVQNEHDFFKFSVQTTQSCGLQLGPISIKSSYGDISKKCRSCEIVYHINKYMKALNLDFEDLSFQLLFS